MFQATRKAAFEVAHNASKSFPGFFYVTFSSTTKNRSLPNPPLDLDPSLQVLLRDIDMSLKSKDSLRKYKELEIVSGAGSPHVHNLPSEEWSPMDTNDDIHEVEGVSRKSPAALFGSDQIGAVILPQELCSAINAMISESQKALLHSDAKRLFLSSAAESGDEDVWDTHYDKAYRSRKQAAQHAVRDGTAFASVALPAHYSAVTSVLHHAKLRLGPSWSVDRIIDWGAGTGSGLWASVYSFNSHIGHEAHDPTAVNSSIKSYLGIDKREGLVSIGKRLVNSISADSLLVTWQKSFREDDILPQEVAQSTIALSAFMLTTLPTAIAQKRLVEEMWTSGAHTLILIDHDTPEGFKAIAHAREHILELSRHETEDSNASSNNPTGCHVLAPCPHDRRCPLLHSGGTPLICGFSQRLQRPQFLQRTKHSGIGHEDVRYSYVVIRRGPRPNSIETNAGRIGGIGLRVLTKALENVPAKELHVEGQTSAVAPIPENLSLDLNPVLTGFELRDHLRKEAYQWPRLVFPPLKKSGHIILDACTSEGKIMRLTIPRSQGKQPYYDARKSSWGDIFPHPPKNAPQERYQPKTYRKRGRPSSGDDIGKRKELHQKRECANYNGIADQMKEKKKLSKRDYAKIREDKVWYGMS